MKLFVVAALVALACAHGHGDHGKMGDMQDGMSDMKDMMNGMNHAEMMAHMHHSAMKKEIMEMMHMLGITQNFTESFEYVDKDKDGNWTIEEYMNATNMADLNGDGMISITEYINSSVSSGMSNGGALYFFFRADNNTNAIYDASEQMANFKAMDMNHNGMVSEMEFMQSVAMVIMDMAMSSKLKSAVEKLYLAAESNQDGNLTLAEFKIAINMSDTDRDGMISEREFVTAWVKSTNDTIKRGRAFFAMLDAAANKDDMLGDDDLSVIHSGMDYDVDGIVSLEEFMNSMTYFAARTDEIMVVGIYKAFMSLDSDNDGSVSEDEFLAAINELDANKDGVVNASEFLGQSVQIGGEIQTEAMFYLFRMDNNSDSEISQDEIKLWFMGTDMDMNKMGSFGEYKMVATHMSMLVDRAMKMQPGLEAIFHGDDTNGDGMVSLDEIKARSGADTDNDGSLSKDEFVAYWMNAIGLSKEMSGVFFSMIDYRSMDGVIGEDDVDTFFNNADFNKDGKMSEDEYLNMMLYYYARITAHMDMMMMKKMKMKFMHHMMIKHHVKMMMHKLNITQDWDAVFSFGDADKDHMWSNDEYVKLAKMSDADGDGKVNASEFIGSMVAGGMNFRTALYTFFRIDSNDDEVIDESEMNSNFAGIDMNHDGMVSSMEYKGTMIMLVMDMAMASMKVPGIEMQFKMADTDKDDQLSQDELRVAVSMADTNGDQKITEYEFVTMWVKDTNDTVKGGKAFFAMLDAAGKKDNMLGDDDLKQVFSGMDYDMDGKVSMDEYLNSMTWFAAKIDENMVMEKAKQFEMVDTNMDGKVDMDEYKAVLMPMDANNDTMLSAEEFVGGSVAAGIDYTEALYSFFRMDNNTDQMLDHHELKHSFMAADMDMDHMLSFMEDKIASARIGMQIDEAQKVEPALKAEFAADDANGNGLVTMAELKARVSVSDTDGDGSVNKEEFVAFWMNITGFDKARSDMFFSMLDYSSMDGVLGDDDFKQFFRNADFNKDTMISEREYLDTMLFFYAKIMQKVDMQMKMKMMEMMNGMNSGAQKMSFDPQNAFNMADADGNGLVTRPEFAGLMNSMDANADGKVNSTEFVRGFSMTGLSADQSLYVFFRIDDNEDGVIDDVEREDTFSAFDMDKNDVVDVTEFTNVMTGLLGETMRAQNAQPKIEAMFTAADADMSGDLSSDELKGILSSMDKDGDGLASEAEFTEWWMNKTGADMESSYLMFENLDVDNDGYFGNDFETTGLFAGFDINRNGSIDKDEFFENLLFLFAKTQRQQAEAERLANAVIGFFF